MDWHDTKKLVCQDGHSNRKAHLGLQAGGFRLPSQSFYGPEAFGWALAQIRVAIPHESGQGSPMKLPNKVLSFWVELVVWILVV